MTRNSLPNYERKANHLMYFWFSEKQCQVAGTIFYRNLEGQEVEVTAVSEDEEHGLFYDDVMFVGRGCYKDFIRMGRQVKDHEPILFHYRETPRLEGK